MDKEFAVGQTVAVTIHKNGYWKGIEYGKFCGWTKNGRVRVQFRDRIGNFDSRNVESCQEKPDEAR